MFKSLKPHLITVIQDKTATSAARSSVRITNYHHCFLYASFYTLVHGCVTFILLVLVGFSLIFCMGKSLYSQCVFLITARIVNSANCRWGGGGGELDEMLEVPLIESGICSFCFPSLTSLVFKSVPLVQEITNPTKFLFSAKL